MGEKVLIQLGSESLGDNISWIPHVREFQLLHEAEVDDRDPRDNNSRHYKSSIRLYE